MHRKVCLKMCRTGTLVVIIMPGVEDRYRHALYRKFMPLGLHESSWRMPIRRV
jgi:hypothetical protein